MSKKERRFDFWMGIIELGMCVIAFYALMFAIAMVGT